MPHPPARSAAPAANLTPAAGWLQAYLSAVNRAQNIPIEPGDTYTSPEGFLVFTEQYHRKRGYCCTSGCKHCPYGFDKGTGRVRNPKGL